MSHISTVVTGIECCLEGKCPCCPYESNGTCYSKELLMDTMEILKLNQNRVLSLDEIYQADFVYIEFNSKRAIVDNYVEPCGVCSLQPNGYVCLLLRDGGAYSYKQFFNIKDYNVLWRCWRSRPTVLEMRDAKWQTKEK